MADDLAPISPESPMTGGCFCGALTYELTAPPLLSGFCHCTQCQRLNGCPFVHTVHFATSEFRWTHPDGALSAHIQASVNPYKPHKTRFRCGVCGACVASNNARTGRTSIWAGQLARHEGSSSAAVGAAGDGLIRGYGRVAATMHMFYTTRMVDVADGLDKWEGYPGQSARIRS